MILDDKAFELAKQRTLEGKNQKQIANELNELGYLRIGGKKLVQPDISHFLKRRSFYTRHEKYKHGLYKACGHNPQGCLKCNESKNENASLSAQPSN